MLRNKIEKSIHIAVEKTFLEMLFIDIAKTYDMNKNLEYHNVLYVSFLEPKRGCMMLFLPLECKKMILENIHIDSWENLTTQDIDDCLLEVLNVLAGNFLNYFSGKDKKHNMSFPQVIFDETEKTQYNERVDCYFNGENVPFCVSVSMEKEK